MSERPRTFVGRGLHFVGSLFATAASAGRLGEALISRTISRTITQWRQSALRPSPPLLHVASGGPGFAHSIGEPLAGREPHPLSHPALSPLTRQRVQSFLMSLPAWLPRPEQRRQGHGQVVLEWVGDQSRRVSVTISQDDMMLYSARLGARGRMDGAEPFGARVSPVVLHALEQLHD